MGSTTPMAISSLPAPFADPGNKRARAAKSKRLTETEYHFLRLHSKRFATAGLLAIGCVRSISRIRALGLSVLDGRRNALLIAKSCQRSGSQPEGWISYVPVC